MDATKFINWIIPEPNVINGWTLIIILIGIISFVVLSVKIWGLIENKISKKEDVK